ncbi:MAG: GNAT family N-acetyltransferase [Bacteroidota bacterium]
MLTTQIKHFSQLSAKEFHDILQLRIHVFIVEQNCPYEEIDGKDEKSFHLFTQDEEGKVVGVTRILPPNISYKEISIGRVASDTSKRGSGIGQEIMRKSIEFIQHEFGNVPIRISAQKYLLKFYESFGFISTGKEYLEDDIPHVEMLRD